ncbi:MAG: homoserine kinase [Gemmatimonadales bacterium]
MTSATVRVPATSANLGAGYDCIGIALDRVLSASVEVFDSVKPAGAAITMQREGTLASLALLPEDDAIYAGFAAACGAVGRAVPAQLAFSVNSQIPVARGLGSSSAALVAGAKLADSVLGLGLGPVRIAELCTLIEGHPDNVAPAVFGGAILGVANTSVETEQWVFVPLAVHSDLAFIFVVPPFTVETWAARAILPREVPHAVAVRAAGKSAALVQGLATANGALIRIALDDVLHVPFRRELVPGMASVQDAARAAGAYGATLSGSGPTLVAIAPQEAAERVAKAMVSRWSEDGVVAESFLQRRPASIQ